MNPKYFEDPKYEFVFSALKDSTTLPLTFIKTDDIPRLVKDAYGKYDFVIQSRMDFDDFIFKDAVADTQNKIHECDNILAYGYCKGYAYVCDDLRFYYQTWGGKGHPMILQSLILKSSFAKAVPLIILRNSHTEIKAIIKKFLEDNNMEFWEKMFQQNTSTTAFIYFRHEGSHFNLVNSNGKSIESRFQRRKKVTDKDGITKKQLEEEFGFTGYELKSIK